MKIIVKSAQKAIAYLMILMEIKDAKSAKVIIKLWYKIFQVQHQLNAILPLTPKKVSLVSNIHWHAKMGLLIIQQTNVQLIVVLEESYSKTTGKCIQKSGSTQITLYVDNVLGKFTLDQTSGLTLDDPFFSLRFRDKKCCI
ncbi:UNKNOWN [Stylonychia lemnae]|uniref:Uncharacterized protein n=1 Tax=Stylonychia lemnae TaxID=5949 RepID=A0A078ASE3_STYLE|nr:UNKNOWN [Stylonychia lemnae]|eukprot:CDW84886.1 UNKNOWN [Stylonychia lemnae]